jgi:uncharacterized membrane protein YraQ (UPF0718 family)
MLAVFTALADWLVYQVFGLAPGGRWAGALHFFIEDTTKIFALLAVMIYVIALARASLNVERVRGFLAGRHRLVGYGLGAGFGAITPFCSCSSIPVFLGFTSAGIPVGVTMAFLLTSPLINEVAVVLLLGLLGWQITLVYVVVGIAVGMAGGLFLDLIHAERLLQPFAARAYQQAPNAGQQPVQAVRMSMAGRHAFARDELREIFGRVWIWVLVGVGVGALFHGVIPDGWLQANLGDGQWWSVPGAVLLGIPLYSNATGVIPVMESLIVKGLPIGTTMAFCMSTVAASLPEFILLKQAMQLRLLLILFGLLLVSFTLVGWALNLLAPAL